MFLFVGDGPSKEEFEAEIIRNNLQNNVIFTGRQKDVKKYWEKTLQKIFCTVFIQMKSRLKLQDVEKEIIKHLLQKDYQKDVLNQYRLENKRH